MEVYAKLEGSNEFFARRALYNGAIKLARGDLFHAKKYYELAQRCRAAGGVSESTSRRIDSFRIQCS